MSTASFSASPSQKGQRFRLLSVEVDVAIEVHFLSAMLALVAFCIVPELFPYEAIDICSILLTAIWAFEADGNGFLLYGDVHFWLLVLMQVQDQFAHFSDPSGVKRAIRRFTSSVRSTAHSSSFLGFMQCALSAKRIYFGFRTAALNVLGYGLFAASL